MAQERFEVLLRLKNLKPLVGLAVDCCCMPRRKLSDGTIEMMAVVTGDALKKLKRKRTVSVEVLGDTRAEAKLAADQVSRTNRYADGSIPVALGLQEARRVD
jgi:hypothetical protein